MTDFGAFVDLGGIDGLVHVSEISHGHVGKPSDVLSVGDTVNVRILSVDADKERVSLSIKDTLPGPWTNIEEQAAVGSVLTGTVKRLTSFGAFVEVFPGVEVNPSEHRIALSIKALEKAENTNETQEVSEDDYQLPEESTGFTMGDILGDALKDSDEE